MKFDLKKPCGNCPFLKKGGVRLRSRTRVLEIADCFLDSQGAFFPCHKTTVSDDEGERQTTPESQWCAGGILFADKQGNHNQLVRIAGRLRILDIDKMRGRELVFDSLTEMLRANRGR